MKMIDLTHRDDRSIKIEMYIFDYHKYTSLSASILYANDIGKCI